MQEAVPTTEQPMPPPSESRGRLLTVSEIEPDQEEVPPTPGPATPRETQVSQLQEAMRRSVNKLDGYPKRNRSRSLLVHSVPPRMRSNNNKAQVFMDLWPSVHGRRMFS